MNGAVRGWSCVWWGGHSCPPCQRADRNVRPTTLCHRPAALKIAPNRKGPRGGPHGPAPGWRGATNDNLMEVRSMETAKQVSVFLENKPGRLANVLSALAREKVNIIALTVMDSHEHSVLRIVAN